MARFAWDSSPDRPSQHRPRTVPASRKTRPGRGVCLPPRVGFGPRVGHLQGTDEGFGGQVEHLPALPLEAAAYGEALALLVGAAQDSPLVQALAERLRNDGEAVADVVA